MNEPAPLAGSMLIAAKSEQPARWREDVRAALLLARTVEGAAAKLRVARRTLEGWLRADPSLRAGIPLPGPGRPSRIPPPTR